MSREVTVTTPPLELNMHKIVSWNYIFIIYSVYWNYMVYRYECLLELNMLCDYVTRGYGDHPQRVAG